MTDEGDDAATQMRQVPSGSEVLDQLLGGGLPAERTVLVTGGPGTGKSTFGMQFLDEGLDRAEDCLFVSTEQTTDELRDTFAGYDFELDHDDLEIATLHATTGQTLEDDDTDVTLQTLEGEESLGEGYSAPFEPEYIVKHLRQFAPVDRVVLDSVSGLSVMGDDYDQFRRAVLDLIRLFGDEFGATTLFTAEESEPGNADGRASVAVSDAIQYNTHGVIRLWRENVEGDYHRFLEIMKMRGVDHDTRVFETEFDDRGVRLIPRMRTHPGEFVPEDFMEVGIPGFDELLGGGLVEGGTMLIEHDGQASPHSIITNGMRAAAEQDMAILFVPPVELPPKRVEAIIDRDVGNMTEMLNDDRMFLIDYPNIWENTRKNVFKPREYEDQGASELFRTIDDRRGDQPMFSAINVEAQIPVMGTDEMRQVRFWEEENLHQADDTTVYFFNPETMPDELAAFYKNGAWQVVRTWLNDKGLQYLKLKKSPAGYLGSTRLVEYTEGKPFMRLQNPPRGTEGWQ
ncbi:RAD55 family ATPase [Halobaculum sp. MBLA0147]|uniref:RAD55 family ATPase n=1 Tax=Halobaculum sp. MBLA0147 TaxID=3079934 RepID=UPI0035246F1D